MWLYRIVLLCGENIVCFAEVYNDGVFVVSIIFML